jgi:hypothetical protein
MSAEPITLAEQAARYRALAQRSLERLPALAAAANERNTPDNREALAREHKHLARMTAEAVAHEALIAAAAQYREERRKRNPSA